MNIKDAFALSQKDVTPIEYLIEGILPLGTTGDLSAPPDCGKTSILLSLLTAIANQEDSWFDRKIAHGRVLVIGGEKSSEDVWVRDLARCSRVHVEDSMYIAEPVDFLWKFTNGLWTGTKALDEIIQFAKNTQPVLTVIDTVSRSALGYDPLNIVQQTLLGKAVDELRCKIGGTLLTVSHTNQSSQSLNLSQRLDYTSRSGGNGYPGWLRWLASMSTLNCADKKKLKIEQTKRVIAFAVSKTSEMPVPAIGNKFNPILIEIDNDGRLFTLERIVKRSPKKPINKDTNSLNSQKQGKEAAYKEDDYERPTPWHS